VPNCKPPPPPPLGNDAVDLDALAGYGYSNSPCLLGLELDNVICVGAMGADDAPAPYTNYGPRAVAISAPATVVSTWPGGAGARAAWVLGGVWRPLSPDFRPWELCMLGGPNPNPSRPKPRA
jgi:hypothetical protein